jgi:hypothetical protein
VQRPFLDGVLDGVLDGRGVVDGSWTASLWTVGGVHEAYSWMRVLRPGWTDLSTGVQAGTVLSMGVQAGLLSCVDGSGDDVDWRTF